MPKYFFHVLDGQAAIDNVGLDLADEKEARTEALRGVGEMLADAEMNLWLGNEWMMAVVDESGNVLFKLKVAVDYPCRTSTIAHQTAVI